MLTVLAGVAEPERELIRERAAQGIKEAKKRGVKFGRPRLLTNEVVAEIKKLRADGIGVGEIMRRVNLKRATVFAGQRASIDTTTADGKLVFGGRTTVQTKSLIGLNM
jgi:DNA invertase Pin-like site-specific DNA recombinase